MRNNSAISTQREQELWDTIGKARGKFPMTFLSIVRYLQKHGQQLSIIELMYIQQRFGDQGGPFVVPSSVAQFFSQLVGSRRCGSVLDPAGGYGLLGASLAESLPAQRIDVISHLPESEEVTHPLNLESLTLHVGTLSDIGLQLAAQYDAIVASGPVGLKRETRTYETAGGKIELSDDPSCLLIADVADRLSPDGFIAFVMAPRFAWETSSRSVRRNLDRFGLHLSALLTFRPGIFAETSISFDLAIITREQHKDLFVAGVPEDYDAQKELVNRLWKRKQGAMPSQGRLVSENQFHGLQALEAKERASQLAKGKGFDAIPFARAVTEIRLPKRHGTHFERCDDYPNAVYLPEMANTAATTRQEDLPERLKSYLQLLVDTDIILPEYLAELMNTALGQSLRQAVMTGTTIPRINKALLNESTLYLVPVSDQRQALEARSEIHRLRRDLSELESEIWERPRQVAHVIDAIGKLNKEERFEDWIETLPFPLASVLRSYHAVDRTDKEKYERLLHFFEALTEFFATIHLSAFKTSAAQWPTQRDRIAKVLFEQKFSIKRPTFGCWRAINELLAGALRKMINGKEDDRAVAYSLYATTNSMPLDVLSSKELIGLTQRVNNFRNKWTGHGGAVTATEATDRHEILRKDLAKLRDIVGTRFLQYQLIEPREATILAGPIFRCRVRRVMGSNPQLEHQTIDVTTPAKTGSLYLHNPEHDKVLELIPLVQIRDTPQPACYFYSRYENTELHLVSYHFANQSEVSGASSVLAGLFDDFKQSDMSSPEVET